jgi:hypothetical protein
MQYRRKSIIHKVLRRNQPKFLQIGNSGLTLYFQQTLGKLAGAHRGSPVEDYLLKVKPHTGVNL